MESFESLGSPKTFGHSINPKLSLKKAVLTPIFAGFRQLSVQIIALHSMPCHQSFEAKVLQLSGVAHTRPSSGRWR